MNSKLTNKKLIVFDWDGTLMDSTAHIVAAVKTACQDIGLPVPGNDQARNVIGLGLRQAVDTLLPDIDEATYQKFVDTYRKRFFTATANPSVLFHGAMDVLQTLHKRGYWLGVATGKGRNGLDQALEQTKVGALLIHSRCADECHSKPHPQMLLDIMERVGATPEETLMIGDTSYDLEMAKNANVDAIGVSYGAHDKTRLQDYQPVAIIDDINELLDYL